MTFKRDLTGQQFGDWTVLSWSRRLDSGKQMWLCRCKCGVEKEVESHGLTAGRSRQCRMCSVASAAAKRFKHGMSLSPVYKRWASIRARCTNPSSKDWRNYGGRGIGMAPEWVDDFEAFYREVGDPPTSMHTIDRKDMSGHYVPGNIRWVTQAEQRNNARRVKLMSEAL